MRRMLIAEMDEVLTAAAEKIFSAQFEVRTCRDGNTALRLLLDFRPDVLILNLSLPYKDGLTVLQETACTPPVTLVIATYVSPYIEQRCLSLGVGYLMLSPSINALRVRITDMVNQYENAQTPPDLPAQISLHLHILDFDTHGIPFQRLPTALLLYCQDREQCLNTQLYPQVAKVCGCSSTTAERSIGRLICNAWKRRDPVTWAGYGLNTPQAPPSNKAFFNAIADRLK